VGHSHQLYQRGVSGGLTVFLPLRQALARGACDKGNQKQDGGLRAVARIGIRTPSSPVPAATSTSALITGRDADQRERQPRWAAIFAPTVTEKTSPS
jgi:hypothetical protein